jgi:hypothetical protein
MFFLSIIACGQPTSGDEIVAPSHDIDAARIRDEFSGRHIFRHVTFADEHFWTDTLHMNEVIETSVDPTTALGVGLKVDATAVPPDVLASADLTDPATTVALIALDAVVGINGRVNAAGDLVAVGITCALCHSTVDDSVMPGIGNRLDGWPNRTLDPGLILSLSPALSDPETQAVLTSWGPGYYDALWNQDGINDPTLIPPAYGLKGVGLETYGGEGPISFWNAYVAVTQMGGKGSVEWPELGIDIEMTPDVVTPRLPDLLKYQLSLDAPPPPPGSFDAEAAERGKEVFFGDGTCGTCHLEGLYTDARRTLHNPDETGMDPTRAERGGTGQYRTTPLRGAWQHPPYFHDGSAATFEDVVDHYDDYLGLELTDEQKSDLVEFLKSL